MGIILGKIDVAEPPFKVLLTRTNAVKVPYQIRQYDVRYACETSYPELNTSAGFRALAGYIGVMSSSPQNDAAQPIAMTAPVVMESVSSAATTKKMQFFLPQEFHTRESIPNPTNPQVTIQKVPAAKGAVHTFTGTATQGKAKKIAAALVEQLKQDGLEFPTPSEELKMLQTYSLWQYNPPFTIPFLRKNEIWMNLTEDQVDVLLHHHQNDTSR